MEDMKRLLFCWLLLLFILSPASGSPTKNDVIVAMAAVTDSAIANSAAFLATPRYQFPGATLEIKEGETLPSRLVLQQSDIGMYLPVIPPEPVSGSWLERLLAQAAGPLDQVARMYLTVHDWKEGEAILDGTLVPRFPQGMGLSALMRMSLSKEDTPPIIVEADVWVQGRRVSVPVHVNGSFVVRNVKGEGLYIEPEGLSVGV
jgi:hypothetical protein